MPINNYSSWLKKGVPAILIPGLIFATLYGVKNINKLQNYYNDEKIFPKTGLIEKYEDGDTFKLQTGQTVRLIGINAPERGKPGNKEATLALEEITKNKQIWLEYDRYQDDKYGRILAWVWINCESQKLEFAPPNYMHLNGKTSREFLTTNPIGCKNGTLINKEMINVKTTNLGVSSTGTDPSPYSIFTPINYQSRGRLKYKL